MTHDEILRRILNCCGFEYSADELLWRQTKPWTMSDHEFRDFVQLMKDRQ